VQEIATMPALDGILGRGSKQMPGSGALRGRPGVSGRLMNAVLAHLPVGVAVVDAEARLLFWNEQAGCLFGVRPLMGAETPLLADILSGIRDLTPQQRDEISRFTADHIAAGDRTEPDSFLRISLNRDRRIIIQIHGIGLHRWMLVIDDGRMSLMGERRGKGSAGSDALLDPLTGLHNRRHFNQVMRSLVENGQADARHALLMIDLDRFKLINDALGHAVGDALLCLVAGRLRHETRADDLLVRLGGDEFAILITSSDRAEPLAARLIDALSRPYLVEGHIANIGVSVGIACFPEHGREADVLMRHAELALYGAKSTGGRTLQFFESIMAADVQARRELETDLRKALALGELSLAYQAQVNVRTGKLTGFEALLRWEHPTRGSISPETFIPVAEDIGCIMAIGEWALHTACKEAARWPNGLCVAVNVSPRQLANSARLFDVVQAALKISGLSPKRLELEITESSLLEPDEILLHTLNRLRALGVEIAMDDFGTGYSSLSQLRAFPFSKIKIDRRFVSGQQLDHEAAAVIRAITTLGTSLGMTTIAEGVETPAQAAQVEADGCTEIQGYLISRPIPADEIDALLSRLPFLSKDDLSTQ
jgi:diguanylate cyclase (GGDEF)-like protein